MIPLAVAPTVNADSSSCGSGEYIESITVEKVSGPDFEIHVLPTSESRQYPGSRDVTVSMWHQIQGCVPGLYGRLADSIWQQLACHQAFPYEFATGSTYDLESWREPLGSENWIAYGYTRCLNKEGPINAPENGVPGAGNNFPGYLDLVESISNIA